ncbi:MAG: hypothetical protein PHX55_01910 [Eubacteriales bacterium]|nr:hypothetical protein [Eubacteriales bacterium]
MKAVSRKRVTRLVSVMILAFFLPVLFSQVLVSASESVSPPVANPAFPDLQITNSSQAAAVLETGRMRLLYSKNAGSRMHIPASSKLMTALLAVERLEMDVPVTISNVAAAADLEQEPGDGVLLENGDKYPLEYLLLRLMFYDSDGAAVAIAEQISGVESEFVELMNSRAGSLGMSDTVFRNVTGQLDVDEAMLEGNSQSDNLPELTRAALRQYSTAQDTAELLATAMQDTDFSRLLSKESEYVVIEGQPLISMQNQISDLWTLSEGSVLAAFASNRSGSSETSLTISGTAGDIGVVAVTVGGTADQQINDILTILRVTGNSYMTDTLTVAGERFTGGQEQTVDGERFGLLYRKTTYYVRPIQDLFLKDTIRYVSFGPHQRPIQRSMIVGQVVFELKDGTVITVDVGPDQQILSDIAMIDHALSQMQSNPNLTYLILIAFALLIGMMAWQAVANVARLARLIQLIRLEQKLH